MIEYVKVTNNLGEILTLELRNPGNSGFFVRSVEGLGPTKGTINTSPSLAIGGSVFSSVYPNSRQIIFDIGYVDTGGDSVELARQATYQYFPTGKEITIEVKTAYRTGYVKGRVEHNEPDIFSKDSGAKISVLCPYPYVYAINKQTAVFSGVDPNFEFPFENPSLTENLIEFGQVYINTESSVLYDGEVDTGVEIDIYFTGPTSDIYITNVLNSEVMYINAEFVFALTGSEFLTGDRVYISTIPGNKYIYLLRDGVLINILNAISHDSAWFKISRGDNLFIFTGDVYVSNAQMLFRFQNLYEGF